MVKYTGVGNSLEQATLNLYETAETNGVLSEPTNVKYACSVEGVRGKPNADYGMAFASALEKANLTTRQVDLNGLEVEATGTYRVRKKKSTKTQPKPSGSAEQGPSSLNLTDMF